MLRLVLSVSSSAIELAPCEKWIVWPQANDATDQLEEELAARGIRVATYTGSGAEFAFRVGKVPSAHV